MNGQFSPSGGRWSVRRAGTADAEEIARINVAGWRDAYPGLVPDEALADLDVDDMASTYRTLLLAAGQSAIVVAHRAAEVGAFCGVCPARNPGRDAHPALATGELAALYADPPARGTGAGHAAHDAGLEYLAGQGFAWVVLWVLTENHPAQRFYRRHGWTRDDVVRDEDVAGAPVAMTRWSRDLASGEPSPPRRGARWRPR